MKSSKIVTLAGCLALATASLAQKVKEKDVPSAVEIALKSKYPGAAKVTWEKEKGNFDANWGGRSGEDMSVMFTPTGAFIEQVEALQPNALPAPALIYIKKAMGNVKIKETGRVTDAVGKITYEAEIKHKELIFDAEGKLVKIEK
ncbi:hypothetical protein [Mucilaginibacter ginkgonis]|uniref:Uncharacterized protein n=1 Tax=Mucilaginibacter ginkgonis TaxID=2682091 RepID=A0A6I4INV4_9SPHI|nr:hypothetical protein [Mucilaginibacter ginkgonis]QQL48894.1 hypothetical protein GO620_011980 [Mucilaginibacter ginkgonis]